MWQFLRLRSNNVCACVEWTNLMQFRLESSTVSNLMILGFLVMAARRIRLIGLSMCIIIIVYIYFFIFILILNVLIYFYLIDIGANLTGILKPCLKSIVQWVQNYNQCTSAKDIYILWCRREKSRGCSADDGYNKPEAVLYRVPTFSLFLVSWWINLCLICTPAWNCSYLKRNFPFLFRSNVSRNLPREAGPPRYTVATLMYKAANRTQPPSPLSLSLSLSLFLSLFLSLPLSPSPSLYILYSWLK